MKRANRRTAVLLILVVLPLAVSVMVFGNTDREHILQTRQITGSFYIEIESDGFTERIRPWKAEDGYYMILPSYAEKSVRLTFRADSRSGFDLWLDGEKTDQFTARDINDMAGAYSLEIKDKKGKIREGGPLQVLCSFQLPSVFITTSSGSMDIIHAGKDNKEKGLVSVYTQEGICDYAGQLNHIKGRGNVTWEQEKKPYSLSLQQPESLLGMKSTAEWALLAGTMDGSYIRNKLAFDMAQGIGLTDTSDAAFVDLYLNGEYAGLYLLTEKVGLTGREAIGYSADDTIADGKITDGQKDGEEYLLEIEMQERLAGEEYGFQTEQGQAVVIKGKKRISDEEISRLKAHVQSVEDAVYQEDWETVWERMDLDSCVDIYLMEEILQNHDAYISSQYMRLYEQNGGYGKLYSGPVWDFDSCLSPKDGMYAATLTAGQSRKGYAKFWITRMVDNSAFQAQAAERFRDIKAQYLDHKIWENVDSCQKLIGRAVELDCLRWRKQSYEDWQEEILELKRYLSERLQFLEEFWSGRETFHVVHLTMESDIFSDLDYDIKDGETCQDFPRELKKTGFVFKGWYLAGTDTAFTTDTPVYEDLEIEARWEPEPSAGLAAAAKLSGLLQMRYLLFFCMAAGTVILWICDRKRHRK